MPRNGAQRLVEIRDVGAIMAAAKWVLSTKRDGETWPQFEERLGDDLSRATLDRLKRGLGGAGKPLTHVRESTVFAITQMLTDSGEAALHQRMAETIIPPQANDLLRAHGVWEREQLTRYFRRAESPVFMVENDDGATNLLVAAHDPLMADLLEEMTAVHAIDLEEDVSGVARYRWAEYRALLQAVLRDAEAGPALKKFLAYLTEHGHEERYVLARFRILEPLLQAPESGLVEPSWRELSASQLRRFVKAGITRETIFVEVGAQVLQRVQSTVLYGTTALPLLKRPKRARNSPRLHFKR